MKNKLAYRNVKRQIGSYMIYFVSVSIMLGLLFAMNHLIFSKEMQELASESDSFSQSLFGITIFVCIVTALFMGYATSYLVRLRKKEFGMYLTMGMQRSDIQRVFLAESLIMNLLSLGAGGIMGLFLSQLVSMLFSVLMNYPIRFMAISGRGVFYTLVMSLAMFAASSVSSIFYLRKVNIIELLHPAKKEKGEKHLTLHLVLTIGLGIFLAICIFMEYRAIMESFRGMGSPAGVMGWLFGLVVTIFLFNTEFARSITGILLRCRKYLAKETHIFVLRNISGVIRVNAIMIGVLSTLLCGSIGISCIAFVEKRLTDEYVEQETPFDLAGELTEESLISIEEAEAIIRQYVPIQDRRELPIYRMEEECHGDTHLNYDIRFVDEEFDEEELEEIDAAEEEENASVTSSYIRLSDLNRFLEYKQMEPITLGAKEYALVSSSQQVFEEDFLGKTSQVNGHSLTISQVIRNFPAFTNEPAFYVVPDEVVEGMREYAVAYAYTLKNRSYACKELESALFVSDDKYIFTYFSQRAVIEKYYLEEANNMILGLGYISTVFLFMSMAVLSLKVLSGLDEDRIRYSILNRLGVDRRGLEKTLFRQTGMYFLIPAACPLVMTPILAAFFGRIGEQWGLGFGTSAGITLVVAVVIVAIYLMYLTITYEVSKREILRF